MPNFDLHQEGSVVFPDRLVSCEKYNKLINKNINLICGGIDIAKYKM